MVARAGIRRGVRHHYNGGLRVLQSGHFVRIFPYFIQVTVHQRGIPVFLAHLERGALFRGINFFITFFSEHRNPPLLRLCIDNVRGKILSVGGIRLRGEKRVDGFLHGSVVCPALCQVFLRETVPHEHDFHGIARVVFIIEPDFPVGIGVKRYAALLDGYLPVDGAALDVYDGRAGLVSGIGVCLDGHLGGVLS